MRVRELAAGLAGNSLRRGSRRDGWRGGLIHAPGIVGCVAAGLGSQAGCHVPFMRTNGCDPSFREFSNFVGRGRYGRLRCPILSRHEKFSLITDRRASRGYSARHGVCILIPSECTTSGDVCEYRVVDNVAAKGRSIGVHALKVFAIGPLRHRVINRFAEIQGNGPSKSRGNIAEGVAMACRKFCIFFGSTRTFGRLSFGSWRRMNKGGPTPPHLALGAQSHPFPEEEG